MVGERNVRLSGGQRQRIKIARALYSDPDGLIIDGATSALDALTEDIVSGAIRKIMRKKRIIMIAHRRGTVRQADIIYLLENGAIADQGTYEQRLDKSDKFRRLANEKN